MPKAKCIELGRRSWGPCLLGISMGLGVCVAQAQTTPPSLGDVVDTAKKAKAQEFSKSLNDAFRSPPGAPSAPDVPGPTGSPLPAPPPPPPPPPNPPMLRAIYGVNHLIEAEVVFDGQAYAIHSMEPRVAIGPWRFGLVSPQGVHLFQKPLTPKQLTQLSSWTDETSASVLDCRVLGMTKNQCLFLPVIKASVDTPPPARSSASSLDFPPLPAARERFAR
jgi:hypothetical protein